MNDAYLNVTMRERDELLGQSMFEAFPSDPQSESHRLLSRSFEQVLKRGEADEIALIRYDIRNRDGSMSVRYWSATHTPLLNDAGEVAYILQHTVDVTELHNLRALRDEMGVVQRAEAVQARNLGLTKEGERLKRLFEQAPGFVAILSGPEHCFQMANEAYRRLVGQRDLIGKTVTEALPEVVEQGFVELLDRVRDSGSAYVGRREKVLIEKETGTTPGERFLDFVYQPIVGESGEVTGVFVQGHDVTEQVETEEQLTLVVNELSHRVKNTLAIVQGLAVQSFKDVAGSAEAQEAFYARLRALASAHILLSPQNWEAASLADTIKRSVEASAGADVHRFRFEGPDVMLSSQKAVGLAMVVHELTTNAIKYGAMSRPSGTVDVRWTLSSNPNGGLAIDWVERGGPTVEPPSRRGFGTHLIERGLSGGKGTVEMRFDPEGLRCVIRSSLGQVQSGSHAEPDKALTA